MSIIVHQAIEYCIDKMYYTSNNKQVYTTDSISYEVMLYHLTKIQPIILISRWQGFYAKFTW